MISLWGIALFGVAIAIAVVVAHRKRDERVDGYESIERVEGVLLM